MTGKGRSMMPISPAILKSVLCCSCQKSFYGRTVQEVRGKNPYLLNCGHSVCGLCCLNVANKVISCGSCGTLTELSSGNGSCPDLPKNMYLLGRLQLGNKLIVTDNISYGVSMKTKNINSEKIVDISYFEENFISCYECSKAEATLSCQQCDCNFCDACWNFVHSSGKSLQKHVRQMSISLGLKNIESCKIHDGKVLEFFCTQCNIYACPTCVVLDHQGENHKPVTLQKRNRELFGEVDELKKEVDLNMKRMCEASKALNQLKRKIPCRDTSYEDLQRQVVHNFVYLHGILQVVEESVLKKLEIAESEKRDHLEEIILQLGRQIEAILGVMRKVEKIKDSDQQMSDVLLERIVDTLITLKNLPYRLVRSKDLGKDASSGNPVVSFDETVIQSLKNYCVLDIPTGDTFELEGDGMDGIGFQYPQESDGEEKLELPRETENDDVISVLSESFDCSKVLQMPKTKPFNWEEGNAYQVFISYVKDPGEFFVIRSSLHKRRERINVSASSWAAKVKHRPVRVQKDENYLVQYAVDNKWYRGRVVEVLPDRDENNEIVSVIYFLDYGNKQEVPLSRMRELPKTLAAEPSLAMKCKLFGCLPRNGTWCKESTKVMLQVLEKSVMTMYVMKVDTDCLEVDLCRRGADDSLDQELISLRDMLVFLEYASFAAGYDSTRKKKSTVNYLTPVAPNTNSFRGIITYVESESLFYIQKIGPETQYLLALMENLGKTYCKRNTKGLIYNPDLDTPCAAIYPHDGKWYRGEITDFPGQERLTVYYVDYGNTEIVHWKSVRKLLPEFLKLMPQAIPCSLAKLSHERDAKWSRNVKDGLERYFTEVLRVFVVGKEGRKLNVVLYTNKNVCINDEMMEGCEAKEMTQTSDTYTGGSDAHETRRGRNRKRKNEPKRTSVSEELQNKSDEVFRTEVKVLQASSPSDIHISLLCFSSRAEELEKELNDFYETSIAGSDDKWEVHAGCAALSCKRAKWYRGTILEILDNAKIRILFKDVMETEDVPVSNVRILDERFFAHPVGAIKCHLSGIFPPEEEWPGLTCEFLQSQLHLYKHIYMTKMGEIVNNSLPIQLWVKKHTQGGALEPSTEEWVVLNDLIVAQGLAVPEKAKLVQHIVEEVIPDGESDRETPESENSSSPDITEEHEDCFIPSVTTVWLPPEPCRKDHFIGVPTYIDADGILYIHDKEEESILNQIRASLEECYKCSKPESHDQYWSEGQLCIVRYHLDGGWYRGKVIQINEDYTYDVMFIDYGNTESCRVTEMRKKIKHLEIPTVAKRFILHDVSPSSEDGRWQSRVIDYIYSSVVEKECQVTVVENAEDPSAPNMIRLRALEDSYDLSEILVKAGFAEFNCHSRPEEGIREKLSCKMNLAVPQKPIRKSYSQLELPEYFKRFPIEVLIVKHSEIIVHILDHESIPAEIRTFISDFVSLTEEIQSVAESQKKLLNFREGEPCISLYSSNRTWYRAEIVHHDAVRDLVLVRYVDYGNEEYVTKDRVRMCSEKWFNVPTMAINLRLHNVRMREGVKERDYMTHLTKHLSQPGLTSEVVNKKENFYLCVVTRKEVLAYQEMIDAGLMELAEKAEVVKKRRVVRLDYT